MICFFFPFVNLLHRWRRSQETPLERASLSALAGDEAALPQFVRDCPVAMKYLRLLGPLDWPNFPERPEDRPWPGPKPHPRAPYVAAYLVKLHQHHTYMSDLRTYLVEHPALVWLLGFKLEPDPSVRYGFDVEASVPSRKQLGRVLRELDNAALQFLLTCTVHLIRAELPPDIAFGQEISIDTKHIKAWVGAPCHARLHRLIRDWRPFAKPPRSPPLASRETAR